MNSATLLESEATTPSPGVWQQTLEKIVLSGIPHKLILGLNYSGMHDTAIALVSRTGEILLASSLERLTRVKQDGRPPHPLLVGLPWDMIDAVAVSTNERPWSPGDPASILHPQPLPVPRTSLLEHGSGFYECLDTLPVPKKFICHQLSHAASAFWLSGLEEALCLTYDGGMCNSPWFGGLYRASHAKGITPLDRFAASHYAKITSLYSVVTGILGFSPNKHEGKITGLAAYGRPTERCRRILDQLFTTEYLQMESLVEWLDVYSKVSSPALVVNSLKREELLRNFGKISREEIAATLQQMTEEHVLEILKRARQQGWDSPHICLSGGLFANVKLNQRIREFGFRSVFVSPPMTDDGTAVGAALMLASSRKEFSPRAAPGVFWGPEFGSDEIENALKEHHLIHFREKDAASFVAEKLGEGRVVGIFQGRMEFGPRALGNRSILSQATKPEVNTTLNARLRRTEFMPFAPITRAEDVSDCYVGLDGVEHTAEFMTITCSCTEKMSREAPAVVHVDGTARPQIVRRLIQPFIHEILTEYRKRTGISALINTSFNVHEEPIVCSPSDAIRGFLEAGVDFLYLEGGYIVSLEENAKSACDFLRKRMAEPTHKDLQLASINNHLHHVSAVADERLRGLIEKELMILSLSRELKRLTAEFENMHRVADERLSGLIEKEEVIRSLSAELKRLRTELENMNGVAGERLGNMIEKEKMILSLSAELKMLRTELEGMNGVAHERLSGLIEKEEVILSLSTELKRLTAEIESMSGVAHVHFGDLIEKEEVILSLLGELESATQELQTTEQMVGLKSIGRRLERLVRYVKARAISLCGIHR
jgi:carbamoyltransferase